MPKRGRASRERRRDRRKHLQTADAAVTATLAAVAPRIVDAPFNDEQRSLEQVAIANAMATSGSNEEDIRHVEVDDLLASPEVDRLVNEMRQKSDNDLAHQQPSDLGRIVGRSYLATLLDDPHGRTVSAKPRRRFRKQKYALKGGLEVTIAPAKGEEVYEDEVDVHYDSVRGSLEVLSASADASQANRAIVEPYVPMYAPRGTRAALPDDEGPSNRDTFVSHSRIPQSARPDDNFGREQNSPVFRDRTAAQRAAFSGAGTVQTSAGLVEINTGLDFSAVARNAT